MVKKIVVFYTSEGTITSICKFENDKPTISEIKKAQEEIETTYNVTSAAVINIIDVIDDENEEGGH